MRSEKFKKAFSLIELSLVVLIVAILIAGATQISNLLEKSNLSTARSLTSSSPVPSIKGLVSWYETTSEKSFSSILNDGDAVATWYDINVQSTIKNNATQSNSSYRPSYKISNITQLPMLYFDGTNDSFDLPDYTIPSGNSAFTIFVANNCICTKSYSAIYSAGNQASGAEVNYMRYMSSPTSMEFDASGSYFVASIPIASKTTIFTATYDNTPNNKSIAFYKNGILETTAAIYLSSDFKISYTNSYIGRTYWAGDFYLGYLGEIIIYNRFLTTEERKSVENYLSKKWRKTSSL
ncbi:MAG: prepilin-type N-terminal cleavage/methylation domain-containing protein [Rickettsiales bacterium]|nr:prepilin-type N-terminal cleavage/methylation domain-containing protein [Rickettsiales bacterium]